MKSLSPRGALPLAFLALGGGTAGACVFIDQFPDVARDPATGGGGGASASTTSSGATGGAGSNGSGASSASSASSAGSTSSNGSGGSGGAVMCVPSSTAPCYDGPPGTEGKGSCKGGTKTCDGNGMGYGACAGQVLPAFQSCKPGAMDTNCDGLSCVGAYAGGKGFGDGGDQEGTAIAIGNGAAVITGFGLGSLDFGNNPTSDLGDPTTPDAFFASFDTSLGPLWSHRFRDSEGRGVAFSPVNGDVVLVGSAQGDVDFGGGTLPSGNPARQDVFAARFTAAGNHLSSQRFGDAAADQIASAVAVGGDGDAVLAGAISGGLDCKNGTTLTSKGGADVLVAKLGPDSKMLWCKSFGDAAEQQATGVAVTPAGNIVVVGWFSGTISFGGPSLTATGASDLFVASLDPSGAHLWSKSIGGGSPMSYAKAMAVAVDGAGNVYSTGFFKNLLNVSNQIKIKTPTTTDENVFVVKLDPNGNPQWGRSIGDSANQEGLGIAVDAEGNVSVTGRFAGKIDFGAPTIPTAAGGNDAFAAKLDPLGNGLWARGFGDGADQAGDAVAADNLGAVWLTGQFAGNIDFGGGVIAGSGGTDVFLAKLSP